MLAAIDPDDRDKWRAVGIILGREFGQSEAAWAIYETWSARSAKFSEDHAGNLARMREAFYKLSTGNPRAGGPQLSVGSVIAWAKEAGHVPKDQLRDGDHYQIAQAVIAAIKAETGEPPVYALGALWRLDVGALWCAKNLDSVAMEIARAFAGGKYCKRGSDFTAIAQVVAKLCENERFFEQAAVGIAAPGGFWLVTESGDIRHEPLTAAHRQRMRVIADPVPDAEPKLLLKVLRDAFAGHQPEQQTRLVQQVFGCAITRTLWRHRLAVLFLGASNAGKRNK